MPSAFAAQPYTGKTAFEQWVDYEGVPLIRGFIVQDLSSVALEPWDRVCAAAKVTHRRMGSDVQKHRGGGRHDRIRG